MPSARIVIIHKGEPTIETVLNETAKSGEKQFLKGRLESVGILEKGMVSGKTSLMLHLITEDNQNIIIETSAAIWHGVQSAIQGAEINFKSKK